MCYRAMLAALLLLGGKAWAMECIAHRGYSAAYPENSLAAITNAWDAGATMVEVDVRVTADQVLVLHHDPDARDRSVDSLTYAELAQLTDPPAPTLQKAFACLTANQVLMLDLKFTSSEHLPLLASSISKSGISPDRLILQSHSLELLDAIHHRIPGTRRFFVTPLDRDGPGQPPPSSRELATILAKHRLDGVSAKGRQFVTKRYIRDFQVRGLQYFVWTINPRDRMTHYRSLGVDGIITDQPNWLNELYPRQEPEHTR